MCICVYSYSHYVPKLLPAPDPSFLSLGSVDSYSLSNLRPLPSSWILC